MAKRNKMSGDGATRRQNAVVAARAASSIRDDLNLLFEMQELKKKKKNKRNLKPKSLSMKRNEAVKQTSNTNRKENRLTASKTLSKPLKEKAQEKSAPKCSDDEDQHSVTQTSKTTKPSASKHPAVVPRNKQLKRFSIPLKSSPSSSVTSLSEVSDYVARSSRGESCSSASSCSSGSSELRQERSRPRCQVMKLTNPLASGANGRPKFKRRNSPHPRVLCAKRTKTRKCRSRSRSCSTAYSANRKSSSTRRQMK